MKVGLTAALPDMVAEPHLNFFLEDRRMLGRSILVRFSSFEFRQQEKVGRRKCSARVLGVGGDDSVQMVPHSYHSLPLPPSDPRDLSIFRPTDIRSKKDDSTSQLGKN